MTAVAGGSVSALLAIILAVFVIVIHFVVVVIQGHVSGRMVKYWDRRPGDSYQMNEVISASLVSFPDPRYGTCMQQKVWEREQY